MSTPAPAPPEDEFEPAMSTGPVYVNVADVRELRSLPGVGKVVAARIVELRERRGLYERPEDLLAVSGIGPKTLERMRHRLRFDRSDGSTPE